MKSLGTDVGGDTSITSTLYSNFEKETTLAYLKEARKERYQTSLTPRNFLKQGPTRIESEND